MPAFGPPYPLIREALRDNQVIPFLGSGASLATRADGSTWVKERFDCLPKTIELAMYLAQKTAFPGDEAIDLPKVAQYYNIVGGRQTLEDDLHTIFAHDYPLTPVHDFLASIDAPLLIVTTNYDDLIERAFDARGRPYDLVIHTTDPALGDKILWFPSEVGEPVMVSANKLYINMNNTNVIYKMHGAVDRTDQGRDQYVITEDDYIDFLARMNVRKAIPAKFAEPFQKRHFLFFGYSLTDWNLRVVLNGIDRQLRRTRTITSWAVRRHPTALEQRFWQQRGVEVYDIDINEFVRELQAG
jgi:hypothetical protein